MRVWIGEEREGTDKGIMTMFVEGEIIDCSDITPLLINHPECKRVYFGAGRKDVTTIFGLKQLYADFPNTKLVLEVSVKDNNAIRKQLDTTIKYISDIIVRVYREDLILGETDIIKVDNGSDVWTHPLDEMTNTSLHDLNKGLFSNDTLIYGRRKRSDK